MHSQSSAKCWRKDFSTIEVYSRLHQNAPKRSHLVRLHASKKRFFLAVLFKRFFFL